MIPLRDNIPSRTTPIVNYGIIALCALVFLVQLANRRGNVSLVERFGMIPVRVLHPERPVPVQEMRSVRTPFGIVQQRGVRPAAPAAVPVWATLITCTFLHGGWLHFLGNMWFLHIFGDNVEDRFGHWGYLGFYIACGLLASFAHLTTNPQSPVPTIGASGAVAGVMGAYYYLYPRAMVLTLIPIIIFIEIVVLPAPLFLGIWFAIQFFQGVFAVGAARATGVAWWAHIGGFAVGIGFAALLNAVHWLRPRSEATPPPTQRIAHYRVYPPRR